MILCQVHLRDFSKEEKELLDIMFFHPYDKLEERGAELIMNYGRGKLCQGTNDFEEACRDCRYVPWIVRKILQRQKQVQFGK